MAHGLRAALLLGAVLATSPALAGVDVKTKGDGFEVRFRCAPGGGARQVAVAGSFNDWSKDATPLRDPEGDGVFEATLDLPAGRHTYKFVIDGSRWTHDVDVSAADADGMGAYNSVLALGDAARAAGSGTAGGAPAEPQGGAKGEAGAFGSTKVRGQSFVGEIYYIEPGTERLPDFTGMQSKGKIYSKSLNVPPREFDAGFPGLTDRFEWFALRYRGTFRAETRGRYRLRLLADDGAKLYINGRLVIDNDGLHEPRSVTRMVDLDAEDYDIVVEYMQGPALEVALQLFVTKPKSTLEEPLEARSPRSGSRERGR